MGSRDYLAGVMVGAVVMWAINVNIKKTPKTNKVQLERVLSKLELKCQDLNDNSLKIDGTPYMLTCDENGIPKLTPYETKPLEAYFNDHQSDGGMP